MQADWARRTAERIAVLLVGLPIIAAVAMLARRWSRRSGLGFLDKVERKPARAFAAADALLRREPDVHTHCQDDLIGSRTISYSREELIAAMPNIGDQVTESARLGGYTITWRVQRISDSGTPPVIQ